MMRSRAEILRQNQHLAETIIRHQILRKQFDQDTFIEKEGVDLKTFGRVISKAIKRNESLKDKPLRFLAGDDEFPFDQPSNVPMIAEDVFRSNQEDLDVREMDNLLLLKELEMLLGGNHLLVISGSVEPWLNQWIEDDDIVEALEFLEGVGLNFNGGFELTGDDIITYLPHLHVLSPRVYMVFEKSSTMLSICKHGNIHFQYYDESEHKLLASFLQSKDFFKIKQCVKRMDPEDFYKLLGKMIEDELGGAL